ncbi:MAG: hypothetical protein F6J93_27765 [Oscillatoria sp. SIO1A7]|nr:hypothetical protein [Oscillatoria sp. SIO1A7]
MKAKVLTAIVTLAAVLPAQGLEFNDCGGFIEARTGGGQACAPEKRGTKSGQYDVPFGAVAMTRFFLVKTSLAIQRKSPDGVWSEYSVTSPEEFKSLEPGLYQVSAPDKEGETRRVEFQVVANPEASRVSEAIAAIENMSSGEKAARSVSKFLCLNGYFFEGAKALEEYRDSQEPSTKKVLSDCYLSSPSLERRIEGALLGADAFSSMNEEERLRFIGDLDSLWTGLD